MVKGIAIINVIKDEVEDDQTPREHLKSDLYLVNSTGALIYNDSVEGLDLSEVIEISRSKLVEFLGEGLAKDDVKICTDEELTKMILVNELSEYKDNLVNKLRKAAESVTESGSLMPGLTEDQKGFISAVNEASEFIIRKL